jgi:hypothetical protein
MKEDIRTLHNTCCREHNEQNDTNQMQQNFHPSEFDKD